MSIKVKCQPIRIAHIIGKMCAGGVETVVFNYYKAINHSKYQFDFYYDDDSTVDPPQELIDLGARFFKLTRYQRLPKYLKELRCHLREEEYSIIHSHLNTLSVFPLYAAWREKVPVRIAHNHSIPGGSEHGRNALKNILRSFSKTFANAFCACSLEAGRWLFGDELVREEKITTLKNAINFSTFQINSETIDAKRAELQLPKDSFVLGHVGRFTAAKNHEKVISVFKALKEVVPKAQLLLIGDGEEREKIERWIDIYDIRNSVIMTGKVSDVQNYYPLIDVLILPSVFEGVPVTIIESQIAGVPCVISDIVNQDVIISDACFFLDVHESDKNWVKEIITASKKKVVLNDHSREYDINCAVKKLEEKYDDLLMR